MNVGLRLCRRFRIYDNSKKTDVTFKSKRKAKKFVKDSNKLDGKELEIKREFHTCVQVGALRID
jgi:hypothetical protein